MTITLNPIHHNSKEGPMKCITSSLLILASFALTFVSCQAPKTNVAEVRKTIEENLERYLNSFNAKDAVTVASFYASDAIVLPPNGQRVTGRENIETMFKQMTGVVRDFRATTSNVDASGDLACEVGSYTMSIQMPDHPAMADTGKYVVVWKRQPDGNWLIVADIFNTDLPLPGPPPAEKK